MKPIKISSVGNIKELIEVKLTRKEDIFGIASLLNKPILEAVDFSRRDAHNFQMTKTHSFLCVIDNRIIYKFVYDIKDEEKDG